MWTRTDRINAQYRPRAFSAVSLQRNGVWGSIHTVHVMFGRSESLRRPVLLQVHIRCKHWTRLMRTEISKRLDNIRFSIQKGFSLFYFLVYLFCWFFISILIQFHIFIPFGCTVHIEIFFIVYIRINMYICSRYSSTRYIQYNSLM